MDLQYVPLVNILLNKNSNYKNYPLILLLFCLLYLVSSGAKSSEVTDPHYTKAGFFDIHVCNWPNRPLFFLTLVSTTKFKDISSIEIYSPDNSKLGNLNLKKFRLIKDKKKKEKRVFIKQFEIPKSAQNGWYYTKINLKNGSSITAKDYVVIEKLERAKLLTPDISKDLDAVPAVFKWEKIPGANFYQVFIKDVWESKQIHSSKLLPKPELKIPKNLLKKGGFYTIQIHARDINEHQLLGDFNHGSLTSKMEFSISD